MKLRLLASLIIFAFAAIMMMIMFSPLPLIYAPPEPDPVHAFRYSEHVLVGEIISYEIKSAPVHTSDGEYAGLVIYEIKVDAYLKNPLENKIIKAPGYYIDDLEPMSTFNLLFESEQKVILYLQEDGHNNFSDHDLIIRDQESKIIQGDVAEFLENIESPVDLADIYQKKISANTLFPLKQLQLGVSVDQIQCKDNLVLIQKYDDSPACVKPQTKEKLEQRGWTYQKESALLTLDDNQQDVGRYLKHILILDETSIDATVSYPTNTKHHKMFPDEHQSIVSDCTENNNNDAATLSLLYLKEIDNIQNKMTFKVEDKKFDGLQCDDALWQELTRWGYCGPSDHVISHIDVVVPSVSDAQRQVSGFVFDVPKYLPQGYDIQKVTVGRDNDRATLYISPEPITDETQTCDFAWSHEGIYLFYNVHPEILSFGSRYLDVPGEPQSWPVTINGNQGKAEQRKVGDRFGMPIPQSSNLQISMPESGVLVQMSSSLPVEELIRIAESMSDPIFNSDIVPDYSLDKLQPEPEPTSTAHQNLIDARNKLRDAYHDNTSFGPFNIKDVVVGYEISDGFLKVDILEEYYNSERYYPLIIQKIIDITGGKVDISFLSSNAVSPTSIESIFPHIWNGFLHRNGIEFTPKDQSYANTDNGYEGVHRVCSPVIASNGTELYISSIFIYEPFEITGTYIDKTKPADCYKIWKTDAVLEEPDKSLMLWLENYHKGN